VLALPAEPAFNSRDPRRLKRPRKCPECGAVLNVTRAGMEGHRRRKHRPWTQKGATRILEALW
jgi:hypothetical protein